MRGDHAALRHDAEVFARLEDDGTGTVAEEDAGAPIRPVENAREGLRADHQGALVRAGCEELVGRGEREQILEHTA